MRRVLSQRNPSPPSYSVTYIDIHVYGVYSHSHLSLSLSIGLIPFPAAHMELLRYREKGPV
jgi:hypothetical protein